MNLYGLFILGAKIEYTLFSILYGYVNVAMAFKEIIINLRLIPYH